MKIPELCNKSEDMPFVIATGHLNIPFLNDRCNVALDESFSILVTSNALGVGSINLLHLSVDCPSFAYEWNSVEFYCDAISIRLQVETRKHPKTGHPP